MGFHLYWVLLVISGAIMIVVSATGFGQRTPGARAVNAIIGAAFAGYGVYLGFFFTHGNYYVIWYAFVVPILLVVNAVKQFNANKARTAVRQPMPPQQQNWQPIAPTQPGSPQVQTPPPAPTATGPTLTSDDVLGR